MLEFERDPLFKLDDMHDLSKDQLRERTMEKVCCCVDAASSIIIVSC